MGMPGIAGGGWVLRDGHGLLRSEIRRPGLPDRDSAFRAPFKNFSRLDAASKTVANWMTGELFRLMNETGEDIEQVKIKPADLVELVELVGKDQVNQSTAKAVFKEMYATGQSPAAIIERKGLTQISDAGALEAIVERVLDENPKPLGEFLAGKESIFKWLLGQVMKATRGQADPLVAQEVLRSALDRRRTALGG